MLDLKDREYFRRVQDGDAYQYNFDDKPVSFYIEPIYSNITGEFKVNLSIKSRTTVTDTAQVKAGTTFQTASVVAFSTRMYTEPRPILPREFGFCFVNESGKVLIHSDVKRSLLENLVEESNGNMLLRQAIKKREDKLINNVLYYGDAHNMRIRPIPQLPLFLVTYYNKDVITSTNSRIAAFALFTTLSLMVFLFLAHKIWRLQSQKSTRLNFTAGKYSWFRPQQYTRAELLHMADFITAYTLLVIAYNLFDMFFISKNLWVLFFNIFLMPFYAYCGLLSIRTRFFQKQYIRISRAAWFFLLMLLLNSLFYYYTQDEVIYDTGSELYYLDVLVFQLLTIVFIARFQWVNTTVISVVKNRQYLTEGEWG